MAGSGSAGSSAGGDSGNEANDAGQQSNTAGRNARARARLSCKQCRERKLKCDRQNPCRACITRGQAASCTFYISDQNRQFVALHDRVQELTTEVDSLRGLLNHQTVAGASAPMPWVYASPYSPGPASPFSERSQMIQRFEYRMGHVHSGVRFAWLENVIHIEAQETSLLGMAITSCAMASAGVEDANRELLNDSLQPYINSLNLLQSAFTSDVAFERETLHAALLLSMYELLTLDQSSPWARHVYGVGRLIHTRGPHRHVDDAENKAFRFFRAIAVVVDIVRRQSSFLAESEWKTIPWSRSYPSKDLVDLIEDIAVDTPVLLAESDAIQTLKIDDMERSGRHAVLLQQVQSISQSLAQYREAWISTYPAVQKEFKMRPSSDDSSLDNIIIHVSQTDPLLAQAAIRYYATQLVVLRVQTALAGSPWIDPSFLTATICSIIELQLAVDALDFTIALGLVFPLHVAFEASTVDAEIQTRIFDIWRRLRSDHGIVFAGHEIDRTASALETRLAIEGAGSYR